MARTKRKKKQADIYGLFYQRNGRCAGSQLSGNNYRKSICIETPRWTSVPNLKIMKLFKDFRVACGLNDISWGTGRWFF